MFIPTGPSYSLPVTFKSRTYAIDTPNKKAGLRIAEHPLDVFIAFGSTADIEATLESIKTSHATEVFQLPDNTSYIALICHGNSTRINITIGLIK